MPTQDTKTAADLLQYETFTDPGGQETLSRSKNGLQRWIVKATDGQIFYIKFDNKFSKKTPCCRIQEDYFHATQRRSKDQQVAHRAVNKLHL
jgi:hypothetical protein